MAGVEPKDGGAVMAPRIAKNADVVELLSGWAKHYKKKGDAGAALVMRKAVQEIDELRDALLSLVYYENGKWITSVKGDWDVTYEVAHVLEITKRKTR